MKHKVLLVDDDPNILHGLSRCLRREPYEVLTARTAEEAKSIVQRWPISLVVSDEHMPGMAGTLFCKWIADHCPDVVRIVVTGNQSQEVACRATEVGGVYRFFTKPCDVTELTAAIASGLEEREQMLTEVS